MNQFVKVIFKGTQPHKAYLFIAGEEIQVKDIVICAVKDNDYCIGIVVEDNVDVSAVNLAKVTLPIKYALFLCKSGHDLSTSRNQALKSIFLVFDTSINELLNNAIANGWLVENSEDIKNA